MKKRISKTRMRKKTTKRSSARKKEKEKKTKKKITKAIRLQKLTELNYGMIGKTTK